MLTDAAGRLSGLFTDSDLARLFEQHRDGALDRPIREVMTPGPLTVPATPQGAPVLPHKAPSDVHPAMRNGHGWVGLRTWCG